MAHVTSALTYVLIALAVLLLGVGTAVALVRGRGRRTPTLPSLTLPPQPTSEPSSNVALVEDRPSSTPVEAPGLEQPEPTAGRLGRLRARLARSNTAVGKGLLALLTRDRLDDATWDEVEETLLASDLGVAPTQELVESLRRRTRAEGVQDADGARRLLREELLALVDRSLDRSLATHTDAARPAVVLVVGVNGTGKTTTTGKLARVLVADGRSVVLGAADTFRAAASQQLQTWGDRVGATVVTGAEGADPAAVAFDAVKHAVDEGADVCLIDTAGRLHTKTGLMDELGKVKRVVEKLAPVDEVLLVLDATTGQNGLRQAQVFSEVVAVTGIVLTKLDGTAKGGIVVAVQRELGVPVKLVGLGEGPDDLAPFDAEAFVDALLD
jgi:fused signal recognition particle receptor